MKFEVIDIATVAEKVSKQTKDIINCSDPWFYPNFSEDDYTESGMSEWEDVNYGRR